MAESVQLSSQNPWPGLRAFTESDREFFFGRVRETSDLLDLVQRSSVVVLYGQSGLGKTSLLQAGLFPDLKNSDYLPVRVRFDHSDDAPPLAQQIKNDLAAELARTNSSTPRPGRDETLWEYFHRHDVDFWGPRNRLLTPVIILDQFEEIFTLGQRSDRTEARVAQFAAELEAVLEHRAPEAVRKRLDANPDEARNYDVDRRSVKFAISLREDFLPELDPWRARMPSLLSNRFRLERMTGAQALEVVECGGKDLLDSGAAHEIVDFVSKSKRERTSRTMEQRDVEPALLSVVCDELNRRRIERGKSRITVDLLTDEREEIIQNFYERAFDGVAPGVRDWVEDKLLTASGYRNRAALEDALKAGLPESSFDQLVDRRILHREERSGIVWLELTHDLLSDPASQSRTVRDQRRLADSARQREAELSMQLANSRRRVIVYALMVVIVLLLGTGSVFYVNYRRKVAEESAERAQQQLRDWKLLQQLSSQSSEIGGTWVPTETLLQMINDRNDLFEKGLPQTSTPDELLTVNRAHVAFLTQASESLYDVGRYEEGLKDAQAALAALDQASWPQSSLDAVRLMRAEALHNQAAGFVAMGRPSQAAASYNQALKLVPDTSPENMDPNFAHIYVLSQFGLGEVELEKLAFASAIPHFQAALDFASARKPKSDEEKNEVHWWKVLAYQGLALSQWDGREQEKWYSKGNDELMELMKQDAFNPRWKRQFADLYYRWGFAESSLNRYDQALLLYGQAQTAAQNLVARDPNNRDWQLMLVQTQRGMGLTHYDLGEWDTAQSSLEPAEKTAKALNEGQPGWARAAFLHGLILQTLADIQKTKYSQSNTAPGQEQNPNFNSAAKLYDESHDILQQGQKKAPEDLELLRMETLLTRDQGELRVEEAKMSRKAAKQDKQLLARADGQERAALARYMEALDQFHALEGQAKGSATLLADKAWLLSAIGDVYSDLNQPAKAISSYGDSLAAREMIAKEEPNPDHFDDLSLIHITLGEAYRDAKDFAKARTEFNLAYAATAKSLEGDPQSTTYLGRSAFIHSRFADLESRRDNFEGALDELDKAISTDWQALQYNYADSWLNSNLDAFRTQLDAIEAKLKPNSAADTPTTVAQNKALLDRISELRKKSDPTLLLSHYGQSSAALRPLLPGAWRILTGAEFLAARGDLLGVAKNVKSGEVRVIRKLPLDFYENADLYEAVLKTSDGKDGIVDYVIRGGQRLLLNGSVDQVAEMNKTAPPKLDNPDRATSYLRFWLGSRQPVDDGRLEVVDGPEDLNWLSSATAEQRAGITEKTTPLVLEAGTSGSWNAIGFIELAGELDRASFNISRDGSFTVQRYELVQSNLPISVDVFDDGVRVEETMESIWQASINRNPDDATALKELMSYYSDASRWKDAAVVDKAWIAYLQSHSKDYPDFTKSLANGYFSLSVNQVYSHDFTGALETVDAWKKVAPDDLQMARMRAHTLLFLAHTEDAEAIYVSNYGKKIGTASWENDIAADFKDFDAANLKNDDFPHVLDLFTLKQIDHLKEDPNSEASLEALPEAYFKLKRWQDAMDAEKNWIAFVQREPKNEAERKATLTSAYVTLSWYQLFARDFTGALASSEAGLALTPTDLFLDTNRAHALLFLGRTQDAEAIYVGNKGKKFHPDGDEIWEEAILDDFNTFDAEGLKNTEIPTIRKLLSPASK
jgi:tetratricopeptide (TPR) repeat protein